MGTCPLRSRLRREYAMQMLALKWLHLGIQGMCHNVAFQVDILRESFFTMLALKWLLLGMCHNVAFQVGILRECFFTMLALIWFLPCVSHCMTYKITFFCETLLTFITLIWLLRCVSHCMMHKIMFFCKGFFHNNYIDMASPGYVSLCDFSDVHFPRKLFRNACIGVAFPQCESVNG